jgi:hypothetical protein
MRRDHLVGIAAGGGAGAVLPAAFSGRLATKFCFRRASSEKGGALVHQVK